jgi:putative NADH-flavin reductase
LKLALLGATGGTGRHILEEASGRGHLVTVLARTPSKLAVAGAAARVIKGDALDPAAIDELVSGQDAVVSALGITSRAATTLYSDSARLILDAMRRHDVPHFVAITAGAIVRDRALPTMFRFVVQPILLRVFAGTYRDMMRLEELVRQSDRRWTLVRPSQLTDASGVGSYRVSEQPLRRGWCVSRADLADAVLRCVEDPGHGNRALFVAY